MVPKPTANTGCRGRDGHAGGLHGPMRGPGHIGALRIARDEQLAAIGRGGGQRVGQGRARRARRIHHVPGLLVGTIKAPEALAASSAPKVTASSEAISETADPGSGCPLRPRCRWCR
jgi:hypothetical protein